MLLFCTKCLTEQWEEDLIIKGESSLCYPCANNIRNLEVNQIYNMDCQDGIKLIKTETVDLILTDPPYSVDYLGKQEGLLSMKKLSQELVDSYKSYQEAEFDYKFLSKQFYRVLKNDTHCYIFCGHNQITKWIIPMEKAGFKFCQLLNWENNIPKFDLTRGHKYLENKEQILFFQKGWRRLEYHRNPKEMFRTSFYFPSTKTDDNRWHLCPRPYELLKMLILNSPNESDLILDCFSGSAEHLITAMKLKRNFIGFEISKEFYTKIQERLKNHKQQQRLEVFA